ncbi:hypothetical protein EAF00_012043 [Botryotinia globosa]|nr:hypothetical protein EAF00_012043 [Botryotinia globosa]
MPSPSTIDEDELRQENLLESLENQYSQSSDTLKRNQMLKERALLLSAKVISATEELACLVEYMEKNGSLYDVFPDHEQRADLQIHRKKLVAGRGTMEARLRSLENLYVCNTGVDLYGIFGVRGSRFSKNTYPLLRKILKVMKIHCESQSSVNANDHDDDEEEEKDSDLPTSERKALVREAILQLLSAYVAHKGWDNEQRGLDKNLLMQYLTSGPSMKTFVDWMMTKPWLPDGDVLGYRKGNSDHTGHSDHTGNTDHAANALASNLGKNVATRKQKRGIQPDISLQNVSESKRKKTSAADDTNEDERDGSRSASSGISRETSPEEEGIEIEHARKEGIQHEVIESPLPEPSKEQDTLGDTKSSRCSLPNPGRTLFSPELMVSSPRFEISPTRRRPAPVDRGDGDINSNLNNQQSNPPRYEEDYGHNSSRGSPAPMPSASDQIPDSDGPGPLNDEEEFALSPEENAGHDNEPSSLVSFEIGMDLVVHYQTERQAFVQWAEKLWGIKQELLDRLYRIGPAITSKNVELFDIESKLMKSKEKGSALIDGIGFSPDRGRRLEKSDWDGIFEEIDGCVTLISDIQEEVRVMKEEKRKVEKRLDGFDMSMTATMEEVENVEF